MKKMGIILGCVVILVGMVVLPGMAKKNNGCTTIQDGVLTYAPGHYLTGQSFMLGYDPFGYNYQAHMFNGSYANAYLGRDGFPPYEGDDVAYLAENPTAEFHWTWPYRDIKLQMKWNDAWLSNKDCNDDGKLDRGYSCDPVNANSSACEGAWLTNHQSGTDDENGTECKWNYFVKIVAAPEGAYEDGDNWYTADDVEIGPSIWGAFAIIQEVENDPCAGLHGVQYLSPAGPGFGKYKP